MRKPKPPSPRSVSATLRTAGFAASKYQQDGGTMRRTEGYRAEWQQGDGSPVRVDFITDDTAEFRDMALARMSGTLSRKGWSVTAAARTGHRRHLIVTAKEGNPR